MQGKQLRKLEAELWRAADQLRANSKLTATEYSMPVLGLIFLRHAYNRFQKVKIEVEKTLPSHPQRGKRPLTKKDFEEHNVKEYVNTRVNSIENNVIHAVNTKDESEVTIEADTIVNALGSKKNLFDDSKLTVPFVYVGDCSGERTADISAAIRSGYQAGNEI